jgi:hypothetical protein
MALFRINRSPAAYAFATAGVLFLHAALCYPAAVSRGYPPIPPFDYIAMFLAPAAMAFPPFFDDFHHDARSKLLRNACVAFGFSIIWGIVDANFSSPRPHTGHLLGLVGLIELLFIDVAFWGALYFPVTFLFFFCLEGVMESFWSLIRRFQTTSVLSNDSEG